MAGAVGMQAISPRPLAPQGALGIGHFHGDDLDFGNVRGAGQAAGVEPARKQEAVP